MPSLEQWQEWRVRCALAPCAPSTREALHLFGWQRFGHYARAARGDRLPAGCLPDAAGCWHLLETRLVTGRSRQGKCYKQWLFDRTAGCDDPLDTVQGGAELLVRSVVRDFLRREAPRPRHLSLDAPLDGTAGGLTLAELLPDAAADGADEPDAPRLARDVARAVFEALPSRARLVVLAKHLDVPLYHPVVMHVAGVRRSRVSQLWRGAFERLAAEAGRACPTEDRAGRLRLCLRAAPEMAHLVLQWARVEKRAAAVFRVAEEQA